MSYATLCSKLGDTNSGNVKKIQKEESTDDELKESNKSDHSISINNTGNSSAYQLPNKHYYPFKP